MVVQTYNPRGYWVKIDTEKGEILEHSREKFKGVKVINCPRPLSSDLSALLKGEKSATIKKY